MRNVLLSCVWVGVSLGGPASVLAAQAPPSDTAPAATEEVVSYSVAPGDVLRISVWKEPELSTDVFVRLDGMITVPIVGDVKAAGKTTEQIATEVRTKLRAYLEVPQVTITVTQAVSARFYVIGEVTVSGAFPLTGRITVLQALALAGGFREFAKREKIVVIREHRGERKAILFSFRDLEAGVNLEQNIPVEAGDTLIVP
ncbi:MAG TPA: polysaccharide biosynthesis/export family protein [Vicinamibacteria bacterium]|nr:polysaccharide biosynthesis/export family protein [Vicinamibacteria bacterium]